MDVSMLALLMMLPGALFDAFESIILMIAFFGGCVFAAIWLTRLTRRANARMKAGLDRLLS